MILQDLAAYYHRLGADPDSGIAPLGYQWVEIPFIVVLESDGSFVQIQSTSTQEGKRKRVRSYLVPREVKRTSTTVRPNLLWDHPGYVFGILSDERKEKLRKDQSVKQHEAFIQRITSFHDPAVKAVLSFLRSGSKDHTKDPNWKELLKSNSWVSFRLINDLDLVCQKPEVQEFTKAMLEEGNESFCLVSGQKVPIAGTHKKIEGVWGTKQGRGDIVSFNADAYESQGKKQGDNAPVGVSAEFAYTTALNHLLRKDSPQRMQVGDASTVFWAERAHPLEGMLAALLGGDEATLDNVMAVFKAPQAGRPPLMEDPTGFCVLGLSPNAARIAVRFWYRGQVRDVCHNVLAHFNDLEIDHAPHERLLPVAVILACTTFLNKDDRRLVNTVVCGNAKAIGVLESRIFKPSKLMSNLAGKLYECILKGLPYPESLLPLALLRVRAEREITYPRAALIKALLNRRARFYDLPEKELTVALDLDNENIGYRLGRLFAVLERIQEVAHRPIKLNTTIRDSYYGAASATPVVAFPRLLKLKNHHLSKLKADKPKLVGYWENVISEIIERIDSQVGFPARLDLADQGRFAVGYYHQKMFKKDKPELEEQSTDYQATDELSD